MRLNVAERKKRPHMKCPIECPRRYLVGFVYIISASTVSVRFLSAQIFVNKIKLDMFLH